VNEILGLHNKSKAAVHSVHKLTGPKKKKKKKKWRQIPEDGNLHSNCCEDGGRAKFKI